MESAAGNGSISCDAREAWAAHQGTLDKLRMVVSIAKNEYGAFNDDVTKELDGILSEKTGESGPLEVVDAVMQLVEVLVIPASQLILDQRSQLEAASKGMLAKELELSRLSSVKDNMVKEMELTAMVVDNIQRAVEEVSEERRRAKLQADLLHQEKLNLLNGLVEQGPRAAADWVEAQFRQEGKALPQGWEQMWRTFASESNNGANDGGILLDGGSSEKREAVRKLVFEDMVKDEAEQKTARRLFEDGPADSREWPPGSPGPTDVLGCFGAPEAQSSRQPPPAASQKACVSWESSSPLTKPETLLARTGDSSLGAAGTAGSTWEKSSLASLVSVLSAVMEETRGAAAVVQRKGVLAAPEAVLGFYVHLAARLATYAATTTLTFVKQSSAGFAFQYI